MVWGAFSASGRADLELMKRKQNSSRYTNVLGKSFFSFINRLDRNNAIFNGTTQPYTLLCSRKTCLKQKILYVLDCPTKTPDLNPIENSWEILSRSVYKNKRQFEDRETLKSYIKLYWNDIPSETLKKLIHLMLNRCIKVLQLKGNKCKNRILYNFAVKYKISIVLHLFPA